uniref:Uncharacterized protein n=1 Tax=Arundo donax TaxID=35708 RepID=A0A0A9DBH9_ARUDO
MVKNIRIVLPALTIDMKFLTTSWQGSSQNLKISFNHKKENINIITKKKKENSLVPSRKCFTSWSQTSSSSNTY